MADDPQEAYVLVLTETLQRAIDFLKFAEAKNAALLAFASAWIGVAVNLECKSGTIPSSFAISIPVSLLCAICAGILYRCA